MERIWFEKQTIGALPARAAERWGTREALCFQGRRWTFTEVAQGVDRTARGLMALGVEPGEKVALWMLNRPEWIEAMFAVMKVGAVLVPINTRLRSNDVAYILGHSEARTLLMAGRSGPIDYLAMVREITSALPRLERLVVLGGDRHVEAPRFRAVSWSGMLADGARVSPAALQERSAAVDPDQLAFLPYTSGTTGFPKGVMHDHAIVRNVIDRANRMGITPADVILMYLPLFHLFGFSEGALMSMVTGARQVLAETFDASESLALLEAERATILHGFDTHFQGLLEAQARAPRNVASVRTGILATGMSSSVPIARRARQTFGALLSGYGMSEFGVGAALSFLDSSEEQCVEASGFPAPGYEIRVIDPDSGLDRPPDEAGEILIRSYLTMRGYFGNAEQTARTIDDQGWVHTGDMGILRGDGHLRFMGRYKDMLKIGGENVDPMEVEAFLMEHPAVNLAAVVSLADARLAEVAVAFVRLEAGMRVREDELIDFCRGKIASFKIPRRMVIVDDFPMTGSGKIQKANLRAEAEKRFGAS